MDAMGGVTGVDERTETTEGAASPLPTPPRVLREADPALLGGRKEVVFIDSNLADWQTLVDGAKPGAEVVLLDGGGDGLAQMAAWAEGRSGYDAMHVVSHGQEARLLVGTASLETSSVSYYSAALATIGASLGSDGDILLYGCNIGSDAEGRAFLDAIAQATGADIAASTNDTGAPAVGADWELEQVSGLIEAGGAITELGSALYGHRLTALAVGDLAIIQVSTTDNFFVFAPLTQIAANTTITFTDRAWRTDGAGFQTIATNSTTSSGEFYFSWTPTSNVSAGTLFKVTLPSLTAGDVGIRNLVTDTLTTVSTDALTHGSVVDPFLGSTFSDSGLNGDALLVFNGVATSTPSVGLFITGAYFAESTSVDATTGWRTSSLTNTPITGSSSSLPSTLTSGSATASANTAVSLTTSTTKASDNFAYTGPTTATDRAGWLERFTTRTNFTQQDTTNPSLATFSGNILSFLGSNADSTPPSITSVTIPNSTAKIGDVVTATIAVTSDTDTYTLGSSSVGGFTLGSLSRVSDSAYTATFSVTSGGTDVAAASGVPVSLVLTDAAGNSNTAYTTAISQSTDRIDANRPTISSAAVNGTALTVTFNEAVSITDTTGLTVTVASSTRGATYTSGTGTTTLTFTLASAVANGETVTLAYNPATGNLTDTAANQPASISSQSVTNNTVLVDSTPPAITGVTIPDAAMKIGDVVTATISVTADSDTYTLGTSSIGGFTLGNLSRSNSSTYTASFTVTSGGTDVAGSSSVPVSIVLTDAANNSNTAYTTAISGQGSDAIDANRPVISSVTIANTAMKVGDVVTATIAVTADSDTYTLGTSSIGGFALGSLSRTDSSTYTASFTVTSGGTDVAAGSSIPVSVVLNDAAGNASSTHTTAIAQAGDAIDANAPAVTGVSIPNGTAKIGDVVTATIGVTSDSDTYTLGTSSIGGFALGGLSRTDSSTYTATFTVTSGGTDVAAGSNVPVSVVLNDAAGNASSTFSTAISQSSDRIDANRPTISSAAVNGTALTVTFNEAVSVTDTSGLTVTVAGNTRGATYTSGTGTTTLTFTLASAVTTGETVTLAYSPSTGNLADTAGNAPASVSSQSVTNNSPDNVPPSITGVSIPNGTMKIGDVVTATIGVTSDSDTYTLTSGSIGGFTLGNLSRSNSSTYTATFTVTSGGTDVAAGSDVPVSVVLTDTANNSNTAYTTAIAQAGDAIDAHAPSVTGVTLSKTTAMKVGDVVTATIGVSSDSDTYTLGSSTIGGFTLGSLSRTDSSTYTATFTVTAGGTDVAGASSIPVSVVLTDTAGNAGTAYTTAITGQSADAIDANAPSITGVSIPNGTAKIGDVVTATINVTSDGDTYTLGTSTIGGFALGGLSKVSDSTYTATFTVTSGGTDVAAGSNVPVSLVLNDGAGNASTAYTTAIAQAGDGIDANRPVISSVTIPNGTAKIGDVVTATIAVTADSDTYTLGSSTIGGFALGNLSRTDSSTYTATFTVTSGGTDVAAGSDVPVSVVLTDTAGNSNTAYTTAIAQAGDGIDANRPVISSVAITNAAMKVGDVVTATIGVTADSDTYTLGTSTIGGFALGNLSRTDSSTYTATFTVTSGGTDVAAGSSIPVSVVLNDGAGNASSTHTTAISQSGDAIDAHAPSVTGVTLSKTTAMKVGDVVTATIAVSPDSDTYTLGSSSIGGFALGNLGRTDSSTYTATFTVTAGGTDVAGASDIPVSIVLSDTAGNANTAYTTAIAGQGSDSIDAHGPVINAVTIANQTAKIGDVVTATINVTADDDTYTLTSGSIGGFALGNLGRTDSSTYTATFTVTTGGTDVAAGSDIPVSLVLTDTAGNASTAYTTAISQSADAIDANRPTLASASPADNATGVGIAQNLVLTFSEAVQPGSGDVTLYRTGVTTAVESFAITDARVGVSGSQVTINPTTTLDYSTPYYLEIASGAVTDLAGNAYAGLSGGTAYDFTTGAAPPPPPQDDPPSPAPTTPTVVQTTTRSETVDGVVLQETTQTSSDGTVTQTLDIPIVTTARLEENATTTNADIPLARDTGGQSVLEASLPVGVGLQVETSTTSADQPGSAKGLEGLIRAIQNRTENQPDDKSKMTSVGRVFLNELPQNVDLTVRTIIPVVADKTTAPSQPIVITGTPTIPASGGASSSPQQQAIVIDVRNLPKGTVIQLQNVEFAAIVGDVRITGGTGSQVVVGDSGSQIIVLGADDDTLRGGGGNDFIGSEGGDDVLWGDEGVDTVTGGIGNDVLYGNQQDDLVYGNQGTDTIFGGQDLDTVFGGQDGDVLYGNRANDLLYGQLGADTLFGGQSNDALWGGQGNDLLAGNLGSDTLYGGLGADVFRIGAMEEGGDVIADFEAGVDKLLVFSPNFPGAGGGTLPAQHFALDNPITTDATFVFNTTTGVLSFDADGTGAGAAVTLATLNVRTLGANDILVIGSSG